jgi:rSAM/selenodomain-associated transferase 1
MSRPVVIVMIKAPRAGLVKTRLVPPLSEKQAASLAACFAQDVVRSAAGVAGELLVAYSPADGRDSLEALLPGGLLWCEQRGENLGARLDSVAAHADSLGFAPLVFIAADSPTLPPEFIATAIRWLDEGESDVVLGPTEDGGYYLVGLRRPARGLFQNIAWSTPRAYAQTTENASRLSLRLLRLPAWYDVDTHADLLRLRTEILTDSEAGRRAPATCQWLHTHARSIKVEGAKLDE